MLKAKYAGVNKFYLAIVSGHISKSFIQITAPIGEDSRPEWQNLRMCTDKQPYCVHPRKAETRLIVISRGLHDGYPATKVLLNPVTGRRHQLRVHCAEIGHRIVGDFTYSSRRDTENYRMFLHAKRLILETQSENLDIETNDPFEKRVDSRNDYETIEKVNDLSCCYEIFLDKNFLVHNFVNVS